MTITGEKFDIGTGVLVIFRDLEGNTLETVSTTNVISTSFDFIVPDSLPTDNYYLIIYIDNKGYAGGY